MALPEYGQDPDSWLEIGDPGGGGGGFSPPFMPPAPNPGGFLGGAAAGLTPTGPAGYAQAYQRNRLRPFGLARPQMGGGQMQGGGMGGLLGGQIGMGVQQGGRMAAPSSLGFSPTGIFNQMRQAGWRPGMPAPGGGGQGPPPFNSVVDIINALLTHGTLGDAPGYGGVFGINPPQGIMDAVRQRAISDAGASQRAGQLSIAGRSDVDPSTYGFQSLMSQLQGGSDVSRALGQADLGLRQQQLQNYWNLLNAQLGAHTSQLNTEVGGRWAHANQPGFLGQLAGGVGGLLGSISNPFGGGGGGGAQPPRMGEGGYQYPFYGG